MLYKEERELKLARILLKSLRQTAFMLNQLKMINKTVEINKEGNI